MDLVQTDGAPAAIGPYSQATRGGGLVWCSGQVALRPDGSDDLLQADVSTQARQCLANLAAVLEASGSSLQRVLRCTVFLLDMDDFAAVNAEYAEAFGEHRPARATVAVAGLPKGARVEIDAVAEV